MPADAFLANDNHFHSALIDLCSPPITWDEFSTEAFGVIGLRLNFWTLRGLVAGAIEKVKRGRYILIPTSEETRGHGTHSQAELWKQHLVELLRISEPGQSPTP